MSHTLEVICTREVKARGINNQLVHIFYKVLWIHLGPCSAGVSLDNSPQWQWIIKSILEKCASGGNLRHLQEQELSHPLKLAGKIAMTTAWTAC